ncbi:IPTL-CTERM sorting domain-containing protein [Acidovorax sp. 1608163]|nr:IPTL-CTERM sorting domain-containing protein [Acidovorax sp. 1608163]
MRVCRWLLVLWLAVVGSFCGPAMAQGAMPTLLGDTVSQVVAGSYHTCALSSAGAVWCWGGNGFGQLGDGSTDTRTVPQVVTGLGSGVAAIAAGSLHTCALTTAGAVWCWGHNASGQLGDGSTTHRTTPVAVGSLGAGVAAVTAGEFFSCALTTAAAVQCWGSNYHGQLGDGSTTDRVTPATVSGLGSGIAAVVAGSFHACALTQAGGVQCWGSAGGQLGDGTVLRRETPVAVHGLGSGVAAVAAGRLHTCALTTAGAMQCWGSNGMGQLGDGSTSNRTTPVAVNGMGSGVVAIGANQYQSCAVSAAGAAQCWGVNDFGQLGDGSTTDRASPVAVTGLGAGVAAIAVGGFHACALTTVGSLQCWGANAGQLGDGSHTNRATPVVVSVLGSRAVAIAGGGLHTCGWSEGGAAQCWGRNVEGQLGDGSTTDRTLPVAVSGLGSGVAAVRGGDAHTCAVTKAGAAQCWGRNNYGQLGNGSTADSALPVAVIGLGSGVVAIAVGRNHTCALTTAGAVQCWGRNYPGQLGDGTTTDSAVPVAVTGLGSGVVAIAAGGAYTCALTVAGAVQCWGENSMGQLGHSGATSTTPVGVSGLGSGATAITAGFEHACALTAGGVAQCWGNNATGQLGDGSTTRSNTPVAVSGLGPGVAAITAGEGHTCALSAAGAVQCWGDNGSDQLGLGGRGYYATPVAVNGFASGVASITAGGRHTCVLTTAGVVQCWGSNAVGQFGIGNTNDSNGMAVYLRKAQSLTFTPGTASAGPLPMARLGRGSGLNYSGAGGGGSVVYSTWTPGICTVSGGMATPTGNASVGSLCGVTAALRATSVFDEGSWAPSPVKSQLLVVAKAAPSLTLASSSNPSAYGASVALTATLGSAFSSTGTVVFSVGATTLCTAAVAANTATCTLNGLAVGTTSVTASYGGDANNDPATASALNQTVDAALPGAPTGLTATAGNGSVALAWVAPASNGGSAIIGYTATGTPGGSCTASPPATGCVVSSLANGTAYTFTVRASNTAGEGPAIGSATATPATVPDAPTGLTATPGDRAVALSWTAPASNGGQAITRYTVTGAPGGTCTVAAPATRCTISGLTNGTAYAFTATATSSAGTSSASSSAGATPQVYTNPAVALPGGGTAAVQIGAPPGCTVGTVGINTTIPAGGAAGATAPTGVLRFTASGAGCGTAPLSVRVDYPAGRLAGLTPYKYGPPTAGAAATWFVHGGISGDSVSFSVTDNGVGDNDPAAGAIADPFAPLLVPGVQGIPALSEWGLVLMSLLAAALGMAGLRRRRI